MKSREKVRKIAPKPAALGQILKFKASFGHVLGRRYERLLTAAHGWLGLEAGTQGRIVGGIAHDTCRHVLKVKRSLTTKYNHKLATPKLKEYIYKKIRKQITKAIIIFSYLYVYNTRY